MTKKEFEEWEDTYMPTNKNGEAELDLLGDELGASEIPPPKDPSIPLELIKGGYLVLNADGITTTLPDDPQLNTPLNDRTPYVPTEADIAWCKQNDNDDLPTCYGQAKVRCQGVVLKQAKGYKQSIISRYDHLFK